MPPAAATTLFGTTATYGLITWLICQTKRGDHRAAVVKAVSSVHSILTTGLAIYVLRHSWPVHDSGPRVRHAREQKYFFDDTDNPVVFGRSSQGNTLTAVEAGYLLYDTVALLVFTHLDRAAVHRSQGGQQNGTRHASIWQSAVSMARQDPMTTIHHFSLFFILCVLQIYITVGEERGVWIITTFILMNASTPLLHWRWWRRHLTGRNDIRLDLALAVMFAISRLGSIVWVLWKYADYHNVSVWKAITRQMVMCQVGTAALFAMNLLWLFTMLRGMARRLMAKMKAA